MSIDDLANKLCGVKTPDEAALKAYYFFLEKAKREVIDEDILQAEIKDYTADNSQFGVGV